MAQRVKNPPSIQETQGSISGSGRSPGEVNGYPLQYSCLQNSMDSGAWWATVHGVAESDMIEQLAFSISKLLHIEYVLVNQVSD